MRVSKVGWLDSTATHLSTVLIHREFHIITNHLGSKERRQNDVERQKPKNILQDADLPNDGILVDITKRVKISGIPKGQSHGVHAGNRNGEYEERGEGLAEALD
jgi:hypothetical protein